jgi:hypothetical protein
MIFTSTWVCGSGASEPFVIFQSYSLANSRSRGISGLTGEWATPGFCGTSYAGGSLSGRSL